MFSHINGNSQWENSNHNFCRKVSFLINPHYLFRGVGCIFGILYFKLNGIDAINKMNKQKLI